MTFFFYGANTFALRQQLNQMIQAYVAKAGSDFGLERIDGATIKPRELTAVLQAMPFLATSRLVIVEGAAGNKTIGDKLKGILERVSASTVAVFIEREVDQRTTAFKTLTKADKVVKFEPLSGGKLLNWVTAEISRAGGKAQPGAIREIIELAGDDQWRLSGELNKLVNFDPDITIENVRALVVPSVERSIFELVEAMTAGRSAAALTNFHALLKQKESEIYILTMVQWQLRNLLFVKTAPAGMSPNEVAKEAGMSPYVAGKMAEAQRGVDEDTLVDAFRAAADCEYMIKSGKMKSEAAVEQLIYKVATSAGH